MREKNRCGLTIIVGIITSVLTVASIVAAALWLLDRYDHPYFLVYTNSPGEIVYEDQYQIAAKADGYLTIEELQPSWSPEDNEE